MFRQLVAQRKTTTSQISRFLLSVWFLVEKVSHRSASCDHNRQIHLIPPEMRSKWSVSRDLATSLSSNKTLTTTPTIRMWIGTQQFISIIIIGIGRDMIGFSFERWTPLLFLCFSIEDNRRAKTGWRLKTNIPTAQGSYEPHHGHQSIRDIHIICLHFTHSACLDMAGKDKKEEEFQPNLFLFEKWNFLYFILTPSNPFIHPPSHHCHQSNYTLFLLLPGQHHEQQQQFNQSVMWDSLFLSSTQPPSSTVVIVLRFSGAAALLLLSILHSPQYSSAGLSVSVGLEQDRHSRCIPPGEVMHLTSTDRMCTTAASSSSSSSGYKAAYHVHFADRSRRRSSSSSSPGEGRTNERTCVNMKPSGPCSSSSAHSLSPAWLPSADHNDDGGLVW